jgi:hypothetical protein
MDDKIIDLALDDENYSDFEDVFNILPRLNMNKNCLLLETLWIFKFKAADNEQLNYLSKRLNKASCQQES